MRAGRDQDQPGSQAQHERARRTVGGVALPFRLRQRGTMAYLSDMSYAIWSFAGIAATLLGALVAYLVGSVKRTLIYGMEAPTALVNQLSAGDEIQVMRGPEKLVNPHLIQLELTLRGRRDITSEDWHENAPLVLDVGVPILAVVGDVSLPPSGQFPRCAYRELRCKLGRA
jgi:hypothetical protein